MAVVKVREPVTDRKARADGLKRAALGHFCKRGYACFTELGILKWGRRRADVLGYNFYKRVIICEVKSCPADLYADSKIEEYLTRANAVYLVMTGPDWTKVQARIRKGTFDLHPAIGVLTLGPSGLLRSTRKAKTQTLAPEVLSELESRLIFRCATHTKRNTKRRKVFL